MTSLHHSRMSYFSFFLANSNCACLVNLFLNFVLLILFLFFFFIELKEIKSQLLVHSVDIVIYYLANNR